MPEFYFTRSQVIQEVANKLIAYYKVLKRPEFWRVLSERKLIVRRGVKSPPPPFWIIYPFLKSRTPPLTSPPLPPPFLRQNFQRKINFIAVAEYIYCSPILKKRCFSKHLREYLSGAGTNNTTIRKKDLNHLIFI